MSKGGSKITLYTAHHCPFAHRVQIVLRELNLEFDQVLIDILAPRTPEYLAINSRGQVPALVVNDVVLTESGLILQYLADLYPSHLLKTSSEPNGALQRFEIGQFDAMYSKAHSNFDAVVFASSPEAKIKAANEYVDSVVGNVEQVLIGAAPFFGGLERLTLVEALTAPFLLRVLSFAKYEQLVPSFMLQDLQDKAPNFWAWAQATTAEKSVTAIWDEELVVRRTVERIEKMKSSTK